MAKQGQHKRDAHDPRVSRGRNNPTESMTITTGSYKKQETHEEQARQHKDTAPQAEAAEPRWIKDTRDPLADEHRADHKRNHRSGSDSNASNDTRGN